MSVILDMIALCYTFYTFDKALIYHSLIPPIDFVPLLSQIEFFEAHSALLTPSKRGRKKKIKDQPTQLNDSTTTPSEILVTDTTTANEMTSISNNGEINHENNSNNNHIDT